MPSSDAPKSVFATNASRSVIKYWLSIQMTKIKQMKIEEYQIVGDNDLGAVETQVNKLIEKGWQPFGSLQAVCPVIEVGPAPAFYQAMVKYAPEK